MGTVGENWISQRISTWHTCQVYQVNVHRLYTFWAPLLERYCSWWLASVVHSQRNRRERIPDSPQHARLLVVMMAYRKTQNKNCFSVSKRTHLPFKFTTNNVKHVVQCRWDAIGWLPWWQSKKIYCYDVDVSLQMQTSKEYGSDPSQKWRGRWLLQKGRE